MAVEGSRVELYPEKSPQISAFWRDKYENDAKKYWDIFYKRNANRFFKDRHYLDKEWGQYLQGMALNGEASVGQPELGLSGRRQTFLEVGCGTGNTVYPLLSKYPQSYIYACDFSPRAVDLLKVHEDYDESRVKAFVCDVTRNRLSDSIPPVAVDVITLVFVLSAIGPEKMQGVVCNLKSVLKPGGYVLLRDYAVGDLAQERLMIKDQQISDNFYVRSDGTRAYYFSEDALESLFVKEGFECQEMKVHCRQLENRSRKIVMDRRWIQCVFHLPDHSIQSFVTDNQMKIVSPLPSSLNVSQAQECTSSSQSSLSPINCKGVTSKVLDVKESPDAMVEDEDKTLNTEGQMIVDLSEGCAAELFGVAPPPELSEVAIGKYIVFAKCLPKENQHIFAATGLMLWEPAAAFAELLAMNLAVIEGKAVLELGCGSVGLCSLIMSLAAEKVVATDGDTCTLNLLQDNLQLNQKSFSLDRIICHPLEWGKKKDIDEVKAVVGSSGFQLIIGTDVTYVQEAVPLLFETARTLLTEPTSSSPQPQLILCHRIRRVAESEIISSAISHGFSLTGLWTSKVSCSESEELRSTERAHRAHIESLFKDGLEDMGLNYNSLQIMCFSPVVIK